MYIYANNFFFFFVREKMNFFANWLYKNQHLFLTSKVISCESKLKGITNLHQVSNRFLGSGISPTATIRPTG